MKRIFVITVSVLLSVFCLAQNVIPSGEAYIKPLQQRDSVLVADQLELGIVLEPQAEGVSLQLPDLTAISNDTLAFLGGWRADTLLSHKQIKEIKASIVMVPWEEGHYELPDLPVLRSSSEGVVDTLLFKVPDIDVCTIPVDTATFVIHDIKGQMRYPLTPEEVIPYVIGINLLGLMIALVIGIIMMRRRKTEADEHKEPAYIVALRSLDRFRGDKYWAPDKQKTMYSGITDTLRTYIESRFGVNAEEMTTADIFAQLKGCEDITPELFDDAKELFELSDFVKFAKHTASDEDNAKAIPTAVRFVTMTYQTQLDQEAAEPEKEE